MQALGQLVPPESAQAKPSRETSQQEGGGEASRFRRPTSSQTAAPWRQVLIEHPWTSDLWDHPPIAKMLDQGGLLTKCKAHRCAYGLTGPDSDQPIKKMTGRAVSHPDMESLALTCPGHQYHKTIEGKCCDGENLSAKTARYTDGFVKTWYSCIKPEM